VLDIELECHLWSMLALGCVPTLLKIVDSYNGQHHRQENVPPRSILSELL
jgi:hypothetical protein